MSDRVRVVLRVIDCCTLGLLVVFAALALTGCATVGVPSPNVPDNTYTLVLAALTASRGFLFRTNEEDKHRAFFVLRRVLALGQNSTAPHTALIKRIEEDHDEVQSFVTARFSGDHALTKSAPDGASDAALSDTFSCKMDQHLDIDNIAAVAFPSSNPDEQARLDAIRKDRIAQYHSIRESAARAIIWRAAAIHPGADIPATGTTPLKKQGLWEEGSNVVAPNRLRQDALKEILDRRLRLVERMNFQVNAPPRELVSSGSTTPTPRGPWFDQSRVRLFDYPFFNTARAGDLIAVDSNGRATDPIWSISSTVTRSGVTANTISYSLPEPLPPPPPQPPVKADRWIAARISPSPGPVGTPALNTTWLRDINATHSYSRQFIPAAGGTGPQLSGAIDALMVANKNIWDRPWLYCDHVCLTLHLDALRFALIRRLGKTAADSAFDAIGTNPTSNPDGFVWLGAALGAAPANPGKPSTWKTPNTNSLFEGGDNSVWFENAFISPADLQVGDHVIYYNHMAYNAFVGGAFGLENAIVSQIESDPSPRKHGSVVPATMMVAGHGMPFQSVADFGTDMARQTNEAIVNLRTALKTFSGDFVRKTRLFLLIKWNPYPTLIQGTDRKEPWFVWLPQSFPDRGNPTFQPPYKNRWATPADMLASITHTVLDDPTPGPGYQPRPTSKVVDPTTNETFAMDNGVLYPLYLPLTDDGPVEWTEYFQKRNSNPTLSADLFELQLSQMSDHLNSVTEISGDIPGLYVAGSELLPIQVLRPRVRP